MSRNSAGLDKPKAAMQAFTRYHSMDGPESVAGMLTRHLSTSGPESIGGTFFDVAVLTGMTLLIKSVAMPV
jgi:hypothetical protein